jgi:hypothetical protein
LWGDETKKAIVKYLTDNFTDLKGSNKFHDKFQNITEPPDFSKETQEILRAYMEELIGG